MLKQRVKNLRTIEVSLAGSTANRRKFLLAKPKNEEESDDMGDGMTRGKGV